MRKLLAALVLAAGLGMAQVSLEGLKPSLALVGGNQGFGLEVSWHCLLYQPPVGEVRPALDLTYNNGFKGAFLFRYLYPLAQGLGAGGGIGVAFPDGRVYLRGDVEYSLAQLAGLPLFVGADLGLRGFGSDALAFQVKLGYRF